MIKCRWCSEPLVQERAMVELPNDGIWREFAATNHMIWVHRWGGQHFHDAEPDEGAKK